MPWRPHLRVLQASIRQIAQGKFRPDETRSGMVVEDGSSSDSGSSRPSTASEASDDDADGVTAGEDLDTEVFVVNQRTLVAHRAAEGRPACRKRVPSNAKVCSFMPEAARFCSRCF